MATEGARVRERDRSGPSCATCQSALDAGPPSICSACRAVHHAACVSAERRCSCGAPLFVPALRAAGTQPQVHLGPVLLAFARRELWRWLLPVPLWAVSTWVLATSERVWTEKIAVSGRGDTVMVTVASAGSVRMIVGLLLFAIAPALVAWFLRTRQSATSASDHEPTPLWHGVVEWTVRLLALLFIASVTHDLWRYR
jgi:hypothetical protein